MKSSVIKSSLLMITLMMIAWLVLHEGSRAFEITPIVRNKEVQNLVKRNRWFWAATAALGGILVAAASNINSAWVPILCAVPTSPACWYLAMGTTITTVVGTIAAGAGAFGSARANSKRDIQELHGFSKFHKHGHLDGAMSSVLEQFGIGSVAPVYLNSSTQLSRRSNQHGIRNMWSMSLDIDSIQRRDLNGTTQTGLYWESNFGAHLGVHLKGASVRELVDIVLSAEPGIPLGVKNSRFVKRNGFEVDWVSYNYDNANRDLCQDIAGDRGLEYDLAEDATGFFSSADTWKYCGAATKNDHVGQAQGYEDLGSENAVHGEWYFNTYGGIDGYCNDNKDGAQCPTVGCQ